MDGESISQGDQSKSGDPGRTGGLAELRVSLFKEIDPGSGDQRPSDETQRQPLSVDRSTGPQDVLAACLANYPSDCSLASPFSPECAEGHDWGKY